jgi:poly-gamma-glutamate biosynthesis protein PgsC/CapC
MTFETLFIGLIVAVLYVEIMDIYPGGIIVPAYMALHLDQPLRILATIAAALLSLYTYKILSRFLILFGKRRFVMLVLLGGIWAHFFSEPAGLRAIGWLIPGLLANNLEKQKFIPTLASMFVVSIVTYFLVRVILWF